MDSALAIAFKGGVVLATDQANLFSIIKYLDNVDKIRELSSHSAIAVSGPHYDIMNFTEYLAKNLKLYELAHDGTKLSTHAQANFARNELATALRKGPYQVNGLLAGYDEDVGPSLYLLDYLGTLHQVGFGSHGYASYFCMGVLAKAYHEGLSEEEALVAIRHCIKELQVRFLPSQPNFIVKIVDKDGVRVVEAGADPNDT